MKKVLFFIMAVCLVLQTSLAVAQDKTAAKKKTERKPPEPKKAPGVLVIGNGNAAWAAGLQAAKSGVVSTILLQSADFSVTPATEQLESGILAELSARVRKVKKLDSSARVVLEPAVTGAVLKKWADSTKDLTVIRDVKAQKIERAGRGWSVKTSDGKTLKARVLVLAGAADMQSVKGFSVTTPQALPFGYGDNRYRTSVGAGAEENGFFPLYSLYQDRQENLVFAQPDRSFVLGQAAGAVAAYAAFFDLKTSQSDLKKIQGELLAFNLALVPFGDIAPADPNWRAIQQTGLPGIIKGTLTNGTLHFMPDQPITYAEIKQPMKDFYYKAQIWFDDHAESPMTIDKVISMVAYVGNKSPETTRAEVEKRWKNTYRFKTAFDLQKVATRREFAVLLHDFLTPKPFDIRVDPNGNVVR